MRFWSSLFQILFTGWLLSCIFFVFGSLLAYAGLLYKRYWAVYDSVGTTPYKPDISANSSADNGQLHNHHLNIRDMSVHSTVSRRQMDMTLRKMNYWCLLISVALFVLFNIVYWSFVFSSWVKWTIVRKIHDYEVSLANSTLRPFVILVGIEAYSCFFRKKLKKIVNKLKVLPTRLGFYYRKTSKK